jgi:hypothetical protein
VSFIVVVILALTIVKRVGGSVPANPLAVGKVYVEPEAIGLREKK